MEEDGPERVPLDTSPKVDTSGDANQPHILCSVRWRFAGLLFLCLVLCYVHRVNLSLAVVCMVDFAPKTQQTTINGTLDANVNVTSVNVSYKLGIANVTKFKEDREFKKISDDNDKCQYEGTTSDTTYRPELDWKKSDVSILLSSYFYGSLFTQIPAGSLSDRYGGKFIMAAALALSAICSFLTPPVARFHIAGVFVLRILIGLAGGVYIPVACSMIARWAPIHETSIMLTISACGALSGAVITFMTSGLLCESGFDGGWPSIFYLHGAVTCLVLGLWLIEAYNSPHLHPRITRQERDLIQADRPPTRSRAVGSAKIPWSSILSSIPFWATFIAHFCFNWAFFTVLITIPLFLKDVLNFDAKSNGLYAALPLIFQIVFSLCSSKLSTRLIQKSVLGHLFIRRLFNSIAMFGVAGCLISTGYVTCDNRHVAVVLLCLCCLSAGLVYSGFLVNHPEIAGQFAGTVFGITNAGGVVSSLLASMLAGIMTPNGSQEEWQRVFYLGAGVCMFGALAFLVFSDVRLQPWAAFPKHDTNGENGGKMDTWARQTIEIEISQTNAHELEPMNKHNVIVEPDNKLDSFPERTREIEVEKSQDTNPAHRHNDAIANNSREDAERLANPTGKELDERT